jgi:hypothetical protein
MPTARNPVPRHHRRAGPWVLALLVLATLAPGLSRLHLAARQRIAPWAELCASASARPVAASARGDGDAAAHLLDVCAACVGAAALAGPPTITASSPADRPAQAAPLPPAGSGMAAASWILAPPRGPPAVA